MSAMAVGEKRIKNIEDSLQNASIVLVDIEGTTTSISFVKDTLFPYVRSNLESYLKAHWNDAEFQQDLLLLKEQAKQDKADKVDGAVLIPEDNGDNTMEAVAKNVLWQMDLDRKTKALKQLQGHIMREGYKNGNLKGHVYSDVVPALKSWACSGRQIYVYSSGSVEAQKLLFGHSEEGDLLELFAGHFDTEVGPKVESHSYMNIVKKLDCRSEDIIFLTDLPREAKAAEEAGLKAVLVVREGNELLTEEDRVNFPVIKSFHDFVFEVSAKRRKICTNDGSPANGPISETSNSSGSEKIKAVKKTDVANPESAGSGNIGSSSDDFEMMDVSNNDAQVTNMKPDKAERGSQIIDDMKMTVEDSDTKESENIELESDDLEVSKTESSAPESKTVKAADVEKESLKLCSKHVEECDGKKVSETSLTKLSAEVEVSKVAIDVKLKDSKSDEKDSKAGIIRVNAKSEDTEVGIKGIPANGEETEVDAEETKAVGLSTQDTNVELKVSSNDSGDGADSEAVSGDSKNKSGTESGSLKSESGAMKTGSEYPKTDSGDEVAKVDARDKKDKFCDSKGGSSDVKTDTGDGKPDSSDVKGDSSNQDANLEETKADTQNKKTDDSRMTENMNAGVSQTDVNNTEIEEKMETGSAEIENVKGITPDDVKDTEQIDKDTMGSEMDEITEEMETESSAKLGEKDVALKEEVDMESGGIANGKEKGENTESSEDSSVNQESEVTTLESEVTDKTESDIILHQASEKQYISGSSVDVSPSQTENNKYASGGNKSPEIAEAEYSKSTVKSDTKLANTYASPEESNPEESSEEPKSADKMGDATHIVKIADSEPLTASNNDAAKEDADTNKDTKPLESKNEGDDMSKTAEDTAKENGLASTAEDGKDGVTNNCPDSEQNGEVTDKEQDVKVKKLSVDGSGNSGVTKDDAATPVAATGSS